MRVRKASAFIALATLTSLAVPGTSYAANKAAVNCRAVYGGYSGGYHTIGAWSTLATNARVFRYKVKLVHTSGWVSKWHEYKNYSSRFLLPNTNRVNEIQAWQGGIPCKTWKRPGGDN